MKRYIFIIGVTGGVLVSLLKWAEYRFLVIEHSFEIYAALVAAVFAALGIWLGSKVTSKSDKTVAQKTPILVPAGTPFVANGGKLAELGITPRELEILGLVAHGMSNREIAEKLHVSENTVKTHCSRAFDKLGAKRRTQAVQFAKEFGLLP